jgi:hypothetical protein
MVQYLIIYGRLNNIYFNVHDYLEFALLKVSYPSVDIVETLVYNGADFYSKTKQISPGGFPVIPENFTKTDIKRILNI